jgi:hypothetical protein
MPAEARLAQADRRFLADMVERVAETHRRRRLALARRRRGDRAHQDQLAVRLRLQRLDEIERQFRLVMPVRAQLLRPDVELLARDVQYRTHRRALRNRDVALRITVLILSLGQFPSPS